MGRFFRENWVWIVAPIVVVMIVIAVIWFLTDDPGQSPFQYQAF